jgi:predicted transcriptional regulator
MAGSEDGARQKFAAYVQSVAFQISLSRRMIDLLEGIRDHDNTSYNEFHGHRQAATNSIGAHCFVTYVKALERRGLVTFEEGRKPLPWQLTYAGYLMCELLVESGQMKPEAAKQKAAK